MSRPRTSTAIAQPKPIPLPLIVEKAITAGLAALIVARPLVAGDDPGRLRLTSGGGSISINLTVLLLTVLAGAWRIAREPTGRAQWLWVPALLAGVGVVAFASSRIAADRYARPGFFFGWEWIALAATYFLTRRIAASSADTRGMINVFLATSVSLAGLGVYQSLTKPLGLPSTEVNVPVEPTGLVGDDEFYPELNRPPIATKLPCGTLDSPVALMAFLSLSLPVALVMARAGRGSPRGCWLFAIPIILAAGILAAVLTRPLGGGVGFWSGAFGAIQEQPLFGVGPGNYSRAVSGQTLAPGAWLELTATTGLLGLGVFVAAVAIAIKNAWPRTMVSREDPEKATRWEFYIGGMVGLVLGFIWAYGDVPPEAPAKEVMNLGSAAIYRAVLWFASFAMLETVRAPSRALVISILVGVGIVLLLGIVSDVPGRPTVLFPLFVLLALAANLARPETSGIAGAWDKPVRVAGVMFTAGLALACMITAGLPAWSTASAIRQARMSSRHFPDKHRDFENARFGIGRANALTSARSFLLTNILKPLLDAAERDPHNAALWLEIARWRRPLWQYQLIADPENAARVADETRKAAERAGQLDPNNLAAKRSLFEALLLFRKNSTVRQSERIAAMNKLIGQIAEREPTSEVPLRYRMVQMLLDRGDTEGVDAEAATLLRLDDVEGSPHGRINADQREEILHKVLRKWSWWWVR
jgi:hypothetical protein